MTDSGSDWDEDPGVQLEETQKSPVQAARKVVCRTKVRPGSVQRSITVETQTDTVASGMADKSIQTAGYRKRVKEINITKYHENGRSIENIVEREEFYSM